ncbi:FAD-binding monooxygenase [Chryseobacterium sp. SN22]|uniref:FAD-dependent monooxygenase n=1 Tax=Chryseobacterium sp. SN22 TaxID=2606431 RepID=UPI0011EE03E4|nr:FAD-dependent monooxygenase [Chryseobacterium sp. SN22]KAA0128391.1 FAD-binding monooxygenase [Chryseobacterium sp. SN22]
MEPNQKVLVCGASFAGLTTAYRMKEMGYEVTVIEVAGHLKPGGTPVDIKDETVGIMERMGLLDKLKAQRISPEKWEFKNADDVSGHTVLLGEPPENEFEIERDVLLHMLFDLVKDTATFIFNNTVVTLDENGDGIKVRFRDGTEHLFQFVFGCDGVHSAVRNIWFGEETRYARFPGPYFCIAVAERLLIEEGTYQWYAEPDKSLSMYAYHNKTDIIFIFRPQKEIPYDFRNREQMKEIVNAQMQGVGWRAAELTEELLNSGSFYFDRFCQINMPSWTKGRVALVGDAGYCASPAAGMGGSLAIIGADALADAFEKNRHDFQQAFQMYNRDLRPFVEEVQARALLMLEKLLPATQEEIERRHKNGFEF